MLFDDAVAALQDFVVEKGTARVPRSYVTAGGFRLGIWLHNKRSRYSQGLLSAGEIESLERTGVEWSVHNQEAHTRRALADLDAYRAAHGKPPPADYVTADGFALGSWLQARKYRARRELAEGNPLASEQLSTLGVVLWERDPQALWNTGIASLRRFIDTYGNTRVPLKWKDSEGFPLGRWVNSRRADAIAGRLLPERRTELDALQFEYVLLQSTYSEVRRTREEAHFRARFEELVTFGEAHGHTLVPVRYVTERGTQLGRWVVRQKREHAASRLDPERFDQLDAIGFNWSIRSSAHGASSRQAG